MDVNSGTIWLKVFTNAPACQEAVKILMLAKGMLPNVLSAADLKFVLEDADAKLSEIDFELKPVEVRKDDFEFRDPRSYAFTLETLHPQGGAYQGIAKVSDQGKPLSSFGALFEDKFREPRGGRS